MLRDDKLIAHEPTRHPQFEVSPPPPARTNREPAAHTRTPNPLPSATHKKKQELAIGNVRFKTHDLGGHKAARRLWKNYFAAVEGIVFLVDTTDHPRFDECRDELNQLLSSDELANTPFLVLGNKIDKAGTIPENQLKNVLGLDALTTGKGKGKLADGIRPLEVFMCSIVKRAGYADGFRWLSEFL